MNAAFGSLHNQKSFLLGPKALGVLNCPLGQLRRHGIGLCDSVPKGAPCSCLHRNIGATSVWVGKQASESLSSGQKQVCHSSPTGFLNRDTTGVLDKIILL